MLEELARQLQERVGLSSGQAQQAASVAMEFIQSKLPPEMASALQGQGAGGGGAGGMLGGMFGQRNE